MQGNLYSHRFVCGRKYLVNSAIWEVQRIGVWFWLELLFKAVAPYLLRSPAAGVDSGWKHLVSGASSHMVLCVITSSTGL
jgi:hypothetical protein